MIHACLRPSDFSFRACFEAVVPQRSQDAFRVLDDVWFVVKEKEYLSILSSFSPLMMSSVMYRSRSWIGLHPVC